MWQRKFDKLYALVQDDFTKQWSDKIDECIRDGVTYGFFASSINASFGMKN